MECPGLVPAAGDPVGRAGDWWTGLVSGLNIRESGLVSIWRDRTVMVMGWSWV